MTVKKLTAIENGRLVPTDLSMDADLIEINKVEGNALEVKEALEFLNGNMRFFKSKRYAIALDGADIPSLARFTDDCNNILPLSSLGELFNTILLTIKQTSREDYNTKKVVSDDDDEWS